MSGPDVVVLIWMAAWAAVGAGRGLVEQVLSLTGLAVGALAGSRAASALLPDGRESVWLPLAALAGAALGAVAVQWLLLSAASPLRRRVSRGMARRADRLGGLALGAAVGLAVAWLAAAVVVIQPGERLAEARERVRDSRILTAALTAVPPDRVLGALARVDPFPFLPLPATALPEPDPGLVADPVTRRAIPSVVQVRGRACGVRRQGSGWVAAPGVVATNVHVVAGEDRPSVVLDDGTSRSARPIHVDVANDVALLAVDGLRRPPLALGAPPRTGDAVVLMGYPGGGGLRARAASAGAPQTVLAPDARGEGLGPRSVVVTRGSLGPGSSGGPVVGEDGRVVAMIFGGARDGATGAAVPPGPIRAALAAPDGDADTGPCG